MSDAASCLPALSLPQVSPPGCSCNAGNNHGLERVRNRHAFACMHLHASLGHHKLVHGQVAGFVMKLETKQLLAKRYQFLSSLIEEKTFQLVHPRAQPLPQCRT
jgi:hypothetical protein